MTMKKPWPSREEWAAQAEYAVRTACYPRERVSPDPASWLTAEERQDARDLLALIHPAARRLLHRAIRPLRTEFSDAPTGIGYYDWAEALPAERRTRWEEFVSLRDHRSHLNAAIRATAGDWTNVDSLAFSWGQIMRAAQAVHAAAEQVDRLAWIQRCMLTDRNQAAEEALAAAIARSIAERNTDAGWERELARRARIDAGPLVTFQTL